VGLFPQVGTRGGGGAGPSLVARVLHFPWWLSLPQLAVQACFLCQRGNAASPDLALAPPARRCACFPVLAALALAPVALGMHWGCFQGSLLLCLRGRCLLPWTRGAGSATRSFRWFINFAVLPNCCCHACCCLGFAWLRYLHQNCPRRCDHRPLPGYGDGFPILLETALDAEHAAQSITYLQARCTGVACLSGRSSLPACKAPLCFTPRSLLASHLVWLMPCRTATILTAW
jgi:hypothetical protein